MKALWRDRENDINPTWSPDGRYLVFSSDRSGTYNLYAYEPGRGKLFRMTNVLGGLLEPAISPDGQTVLLTELVEGQTPSTKSAKAFLATLTERKQVLIVIGRSDEAGALSVRNLPGVHVLEPGQLNTYDVLKSDDVVFSVEALNAYISANTTTAEEVSA